MTVSLAVAVSASTSLAHYGERANPVIADSVDAVHRPTGCMARLDYYDGMLTAAFITDPLCLPPGVETRSIPLDPRDFAVPSSAREPVRYR